MSEPIKVVHDPAPNLPQNIRDQIEMTMRNGMVTCPPGKAKTFVLHIAAVMNERADGQQFVSELIDDLKQLEPAEVDSAST